MASYKIVTFFSHSVSNNNNNDMLIYQYGWTAASPTLPPLRGI